MFKHGRSCSQTSLECGRFVAPVHRTIQSEAVLSCGRKECGPRTSEKLRDYNRIIARIKSDVYRYIHAQRWCCPFCDYGCRTEHPRITDQFPQRRSLSSELY